MRSRPSRCWSGLFGLVASVGALVLARRREFGVLRHLGMTRAADRRDARAPKARLLALLGVAVGLALGCADQPGPDPRRQPAIVPLEHGPARCRGAAARGLVACSLIVLAALTASGSRPRGDWAMDVVRAVKEDW